MMHIFADVFARPTRRTVMSDEAGWALPSARRSASGVHPDWDTAGTEMVTAGDVFAPDPDRVEARREIRCSMRD